MSGEILRIAWALIAVLGIIFIIARVLTQRQRFGEPSIVQNIGYVGLGPKRGIVILKVGNEILLVGLTQTEIRLLRTYPEEVIEFKNIKSLEKNIEHLKGLKKLFVNEKSYNEEIP